MPFEIPSDISSLDDATLAAAVTDALAEARTFDSVATEELSAEQTERVIALGDFVLAARAEATSRSEAAARLDAARAALAVEPEPEPEPDPEPAPEPDPEPAVEAAAEPVAPPPAEEPSPAAPTTAEASAEAETPEVIVASAVTPATSAVARAAAGAPSTTETPAQRALPSLVAAAGVPGIGHQEDLVDLDGVGRAVMARLTRYPNTRPRVRQRDEAAVVRPTAAFSQDDYKDDLLMLMAATSPQQVASLVAAGGWGAPSETLYDLCTLGGTTDGLVSLPEVTITRGGIRYTKGFEFADFLADLDETNGLIDQTETEAIAGTPKTAMAITVPSFTDLRLEAVGVQVQAGLLTRQGWPELVRQHVEGALLALQHKISAKVIGKILTYTGAADTVTDGLGNSYDLLAAIELLVNAERQRNRLSQTAPFEALLPFWAKSVIRADLANRSGVDLISVPDSRIEGWFRDHGVAPQWLYNWQEITITSGYPVAYPANVEVVVYPAGTYVKGTAPIITLDTIYDSVLLEENSYVALFSEQGILVANPCGVGKRLSVAFKANGKAGQALSGDLFVDATP